MLVNNVTTTAKISETQNVTKIAPICLSSPGHIQIRVTIKPDIRDATTPFALNLFQKNERITAGEKEQPIPAQAKLTGV